MSTQKEAVEELLSTAGVSINGTTLMAWNDNFQRALPRLRDRYAERFIRMWEYYLLSCAGSFRARTVQVWQIVLTKYGTPQPDCRGV